MTKLTKAERVKMYERLTIELECRQDDFLEFRGEDYFCEDKSKQKEYERFSKKEEELCNKISKLGVRVKSKYEYDPIEDLKRRVGKAADWSKRDKILEDMKKSKTIKIKKKVVPLEDNEYKNKSYIELRNERLKIDKKEIEANQDWSEENIKQLILSNDYMVCICIVRIFEENQTLDEKQTGETKHNNNIGFNAYDSGFLSSLAEQFKLKGYLSEKQIAAGRKAVVKYVRQLINIKIV